MYVDAVELTLVETRVENCCGQSELVGTNSACAVELSHEVPSRSVI